MEISRIVKNIIKVKGVTQTWVSKQMNSIDPNIKMDGTKLSAIICGTRKMTGDELLAFCKATGTNPDEFMI